MSLRNSKKEPYADVFRWLRIKITAISVSFVILVLLIVFATIIASEYNAKIDFVSTQLAVAIRDDSSSIGLSENISESTLRFPPYSGFLPESDGIYPFGKNGSLDVLNEMRNQQPHFSDTNTNLIENRDVMAAVPELGVGSSFSSEEYIPIITYRIDYDSHELVAIDESAAKLTAESYHHARESVLTAPYGFSRDKDSSLCYQKISTSKGDLVAFTDASSVDSYIQNVIQAFTSVFLLVAFSFTLVAWTASKWIIQPVAEAWQRQRRFVADASHELKTPLSVIIASTSLFTQEEHSPETKKWAKTTLDEAERMKLLIGDMLELAAADDGKNIAKEEIDIGREVGRWTLPFEARAFEKGNEIEYDDIELGIMVMGDKQKLQRVMTILLDNACKYSHENGRITVKVSSARKNAVIEVSDIGEAIPKGKEEEVFERFFRLDESRTGKEGYGLGLAMAKDIVEKHGGTISAKSNGNLTTFTVELPKSSGKRISKENNA